MFKLAKLLSVSAVLVSAPSFAEDESKSVVVSGTGGTHEIALNNAFRHAVEQAVGMMVTSESYVKNLKDIQDKVFVASNGFIEQYKVLTEDHDATGYAITISAVVRQKQLKTAMSTATNTAIPLDGGSLIANQMFKEDKTKAYAKEIVVFLDDLIQNGFEYQYGTAKLIPNENITGTYNLMLPDFKIYLKKDWLATLSKYRTSLSEAQLFLDAINLLHLEKWSGNSRSVLSNIIAFRLEAQDARGDVIASRDSRAYGGDNKFVYIHPYLGISSILGLHTESESDYANFRYPNTPDNLRLFYRIGNSYESVYFGPITLDSAAQIKKVVIRAVKIKDYGGKLPLYKGDGVFE